MNKINNINAQLCISFTYVLNPGSSGQTVKQTQTSVIRSNCMDCLDRTNVVQSTIARWILNRQLRDLEILTPDQLLEDQQELMSTYRNGKLYQYPFLSY